MLTRLFVFLMLLASASFGQNSINLNRLLVNDSTLLNGKWIKHINNDSTLNSASETSISTDMALKKYIDQANEENSISRGDITRMMLNPDVLNVKVKFGGAKLGTPIFGFDLNFISSDGIRSIYRVSGDLNFESFSVYGKPPFSVFATINNETIKVLSWLMFSSERLFLGSFVNYSNFILTKPGDTTFISADQIRGNLNIYIDSWFGTDPGIPLFSVNERIKNHSATQSMMLLKFGAAMIQLMPGQEISQRNLWENRPNYNDCYLHPNTFHTAINGEYITGTPITAAIRFTIYRNGELFMTKEMPPFKDDRLIFEIDPTWEDYEIILEDIQP